MIDVEHVRKHIGLRASGPKTQVALRDGFSSASGGLWEKFAKSRSAPAEEHSYLTRLCAFADECMRAPGPAPIDPGLLTSVNKLPAGFGYWSS